MKQAIVCAGLGLALSACSTLSSVKSGADSVKSGADEIKSQKDSSTSAFQDEKGKYKSDGKGSGSGGETPAGATRLEASEAQPNVPISDKIDAKKGKKADWRKFMLLGRPGIASFEVHWDDEEANLDMDVFDKFGVKVGKSPPRLDGQSSKKILVQVEEPGLFYVKIGNTPGSNGSIYTMMVKWKGAPAPEAAREREREKDSHPTPPAHPTPPSTGGGGNQNGAGNGNNTAGGSATGNTPGNTGTGIAQGGGNTGGNAGGGAANNGGMPGPGPGLGGNAGGGFNGPGPYGQNGCPPGQSCPPVPDPNKVFGGIIELLREGSTVTLYIDKGTADKLRPGMRGQILDGAEGERPFEGGSFAITEVRGASRAVAQTTTLQKPLGRNRRVVVHLK